MISEHLTPLQERLYEYLVAIAVHDVASMRQQDVSVAIGASYAGFAKALRRLESVGLVEVVRDKKDRRLVHYRIKGRTQ